MFGFDVGGINHLVETVEDWLLAYGVLIGRPMGLLAISPVFSRLENVASGMVRGAVINALILPLWGKMASTIHPDALGVLNILVLMTKEVMVGMLIGIPLGVPFWALEVAGDIMDQQRGQQQARLASPGGGDEISVVGTVLVMIGIAIYVVSGGLIQITDVLYTSWSVWNPLDMLPLPDARAPVLALELLDMTFRRGFELALPAVFAMMLSDAAMLIITRIASQMHLDDVMSAARNLVFIIFLPLYGSYLVYYNAQDQAAMRNVLTLVVPVLQPSQHGKLPPPGS
jgi:type III secretion protein T